MFEKLSCNRGHPPFHSIPCSIPYALSIVRYGQLCNREDSEWLEKMLIDKAKKCLLEFINIHDELDGVVGYESFRDGFTIGVWFSPADKADSSGTANAPGQSGRIRSAHFAVSSRFRIGIEPQPDSTPQNRCVALFAEIVSFRCLFQRVFALFCAETAGFLSVLHRIFSPCLVCIFRDVPDV